MKLLVAALICLTVSIASAKPKGNSSYFIRRVSAGETFASIAVRYHISPVQLAAFNNLDYYEGPLRSRTIKIPRPKNQQSVQVKKAEVVKTDESAISQPPAAIPQKDTATSDITNSLQKVDTTKDTITLPVDTTSNIIYQPSPDTVEKSAVQQTDSGAAEKKVVIQKEQSSLPSFRDLLPLIIFLTASIILLIAAIFFYRAVKK